MPLFLLHYNQFLKNTIMAELHVQRKRKNFSWLWLIIVALIIAVVVYWYMNYYQQNGELNTNNTTTSADTINNDTTGLKSN